MIDGRGSHLDLDRILADDTAEQTPSTSTSLSPSSSVERLPGRTDTREINNEDDDPYPASRRSQSFYAESSDTGTSTRPLFPLGPSSSSSVQRALRQHPAERLLRLRSSSLLSLSRISVHTGSIGGGGGGGNPFLASTYSESDTMMGNAVRQLLLMPLESSSPAAFSSTATTSSAAVPIRWTKLKTISNQLLSEEMRNRFGVPTVMAVCFDGMMVA